MARWLKRSALALLVAMPILIAAAVGTGWWLLRGSLSQLDGTHALPGLSAPVTVERDALGAVTIHAANELDALRALGYVHAQERYFEMDLMRRSAAGELSELIGPATLDVDKAHRIHRFRALVEAHMAAIAGEQMAPLQAYADGVNAGLHDLNVRPWPYLLLGVQPQPWRQEDTLLVGYAMYFDLQGGDNERELALWRIKQVVPPALWLLLARDGTSWDAPMEGPARGDASLPDATALDLRKLPMPDTVTARNLAEPMAPGSNNFAVSGALTKDRRAIVADDMHLGLRVPDIWFRARLLYPDAKAPDGKVDVSGFTLPGVPGVIVGSNTHVAWGFTNSYGAWLGWVRDCDAADTRPCKRNTTGERTFDEIIRVKGQPDVILKVVESTDGLRRPDLAGADAPLAQTWVAHRPGSLTLGALAMADAGNLEDGIAVANHAGIPAQNVVLGDRSGRIAWTIGGRIPQVPVSACARSLAAQLATPSIATPTSTTNEPTCAAATPLAPAWRERNPSIIDPPSHRLWSANNRVTDGTDLSIIGDGGYALGARAQQLRNDLMAKDRFTEKDLLAIQLDDRAVFLQRWWKLLQGEAVRANTPALRELASAAAHWNGRADPSSVSYRLVRAWRLDVLSRIRDGLLAPAEVALGKDFIMPDLPQLEGVAWPLVTQRPAHLLSRRFAQCTDAAAADATLCHGTHGWDTLFEDAAVHVRDDLSAKGSLPQRRWGERNTAAICHPLAQALPALFKRWLCMPPDELPGDTNMPRVAAPAFGESERMVIAPGHEADGIIETPGGQSGNPLSPFWGAGHEAWVRGKPTPFLPGPPTHTLRLLPAR
ncbi:MAG: penicillin acylase family protein [Proteobacteria bacterium]|nr:penicillin acylase family protein [Pseudomonadota bacterium]